MRKYLLVLFAAYFGSSVGYSQPASGSPAPKLVLMISIDQMRYDYLERFDPLFKGGFRQLIDRGGIFTNANYRHAATETGPGHSGTADRQSPQPLGHRRERLVGSLSRQSHQRHR